LRHFGGAACDNSMQQAMRASESIAKLSEKCFATLAGQWSVFFRCEKRSTTTTANGNRMTFFLRIKNTQGNPPTNELKFYAF